PDTLTHQSTYLDNRFLDAGFHDRMERRRVEDPEGYRIYGLGEWGETAGLILTNYCIEDFDRNPARWDARYFGQDFGYNHYNALLDVGFRDGELFICRELYIREKDTGEIIGLANREKWDRSVEMFCDSAEPDRIRTWRTSGYRASPVVKEPGSVLAQIDFLKRLRIHIHPSCVGTIREIQMWKWKRDVKTGAWLDEPDPHDDDAMAALRYAVERARKGAHISVLR
ncbi:MAG: PBSX family phage terminase large subunit, partial [Eubacteriales bacterium]